MGMRRSKTKVIALVVVVVTLCIIAALWQIIILHVMYPNRRESSGRS